MSTYKALVDLVVAGKAVEAGSTFETTDEQAAPAIAFGLAEVVEGKAPLTAGKRSGTKRGSRKES